MAMLARGNSQLRARVSLTSAQSSVFHHQCRHEGNPFYNVGGYIRFERGNVDRLKAAHARVLETFEAFRLRIVVDDEGVYQTHVPPTTAQLPLVDLSMQPDPEAAANAWLDELFSTCIGIESGELYRAALLKLSDELHYYVGMGHHIALDGIGFVNWGAALARFYDDPSGDWLEGDREVSNAELAKRDLDYRASERYEKDRRFWTEKVQGFNDSLFPVVHDDASVGASDRSARETLRLSPELQAKLDGLSTAVGVERHQLVLCLLSIYFGLSYRSDSVVIGIPLHGRQSEAERHKIGMLTQMSPLLVNVDAAAPIVATAGAIRSAQRELLRYRRFPAAELVNAPLNPRPRDQPFDLAYSYLQVGEAPSFGGTPGSLVYCSHGHEQIPLLVTYWDSREDGDSALFFDYNLGHFSSSEIGAIIHRLLHLIDQLLDDVDQPLSRLDCVTTEERQHLLAVAAGGDRGPGMDFDLGHRLASQFADRPERVALEGDFGRILYGELERRVLAVAASLRDAHEVAKGDRVAVLLPHSPELIVALLALIRLGAVYVPIDPQSPAPRTRHILADSGARLVLTGSGCRSGSEDSASGCDWLSIESLQSGTGADLTPPDPPVDAGDPLYVLYTSGSTGVPKGVLIARGAAENLLGGFVHRVQPGVDGRWLFISSVAFDISIVEWLGCLALGNTCVLPSPEQLADPFALAAMANAVAPTFVQTTPSRLKQLYSAGWRPHAGQCVVSAGEPLPGELADALLACGAALWNGYGPTEATVYSLIKRVHADESLLSRTAIGGQLPGYRHYVLNKHRGLVPPGLPGELAIAGIGLAVGYVNRLDLTERQFVPGGPLPEARLYLTGDVVRRLGDDSFQYLGRNDDQIKLRGYRIELSEIQSVIRQLEGVRDVAVVHRKAENDRPASLVAYVCMGAGGEEALARIRSELSRSLPDYMVPSAFVALDALPVNTNGKLDKSRLPAPHDGSPESFVPLGSASERRVAQVWSDLLGVPMAALGGDGDFFVLGGDSVLAVRMVGRLRNATARKVEVGDLFRHSRLSALAARIDDLPPWVAQARIPPIARDAASYPVSVAQRQLWYLCDQDPEAGHYNMAVAYRIDGPLQPSEVESALSSLLRRHEALRTVYRHTEEGLRQVVLPAPEWRLEIVDGCGWSVEECAERTEAAQARHAEASFDLGTELPFRAQLILLQAGHAVLLLNLHHIAADGWSIRMLFEEFVINYAAQARGEPATLPEPQRRYVDFAAWQQTALASGTWDGQLAYWERILADAPPSHALPLDGRGPVRPARIVPPVTGMIPPALASKLKQLAQRLAVTEFSVMQSVFALLLCKWSYQDEVVIGSPAHGRNAAELESTVGMFVNLLAYVHRFGSEQSFGEYLIRFQAQAAEALENQDIPFERVVEALRPQRDSASNPIFQLLFAFQDDLPERLDVADLHFRRLPERGMATKFDLELLISRQEDGWRCHWVSAPELFERHSVQALASTYVELLERVADDPQRAVGKIGLLASLPSASDRVAVDGVAGAHQLVERRAAHRPDAIAVRFGEETLRYGEFNRRANRLARLLLTRGIAPGSRVALCLPRSTDLIVAAVAVLKAGCAYVPVDPEYPAARQAYLFSDAAPACVLTTQRLATEHASNFGACETLALDDPGLQAALTRVAADDIAPEQVGLSPESDAYVIYTSGSTGQPKGVLIAHRGLINLALVQSPAFGIDQTSRVLQFASFSFDAAVSEWSTALASGAELVLVSEDTVRDATALARWASAHGVTHATLPPVVLKRSEPSAWSTLTHAISAGEAISLEEARRWSAHCRFINAYGPSESTVCASIGGINETYGRLTIGQAMAGLDLYVLDKHLRPVPRGAVGELCISGIALAKGYLNKPQQTRAAFVDLSLDDGRRLAIYRTGDRVRQLPDGDLLFEGRVDEQVKIRGHRVECGEVETCILDHPAIREAAVCVRTLAGGDLVLAAYVVPVADADIGLVDDLRLRLKAQLPPYMVPTMIVPIDALPLNRSGKIDKTRLAALDPPMPERVPQRALTDTEQAVSDLWVSFLGAAADDPDRGFFESGGYSLLVSDVLGALHARFGVRLSYREFFEHATIAALAALIDMRPRESTATASASVARTSREGRSHPLSFEQQRIWLIDRMEQGSHHYNMPVALQLSGRIVPEFIEAALRSIVARHESLRTVFAVDASDRPQQVVAHSATLHLESLHVSAADRDETVRRLRAEEQYSPFDLKRDLLLRVRLLHVAEGEAVLFLTLHHIAADGWSVDRLIAEFRELYAGLLDGSGHELAPLPLQYKDYASDQRDWAESGGLREGVAFWRRQIEGAPQSHTLPLDFARGDAPSLRGRSWTSRIPLELALGLKTLSRQHDTTLFVTLQTVFALMIARWSEHRDVLIGTPVANRLRPEVAPLIGFFANTLVLRTDCRENLSFGELLRRGRDGFLGAFEYQHLPFDVLVDELTLVRNPAHAPLIQILFSLQDDPSRKLAKLELPELSLRVLEEDGERPVKFDLELMMSESDDGLICQWSFDTALFMEQTIHRLFDSFVLLLQAVVADADRRIHEIDIVGRAEYEALMAPPRALPSRLVPGGSICERFERMAQRRGDALAVIDGGRRLDYAELEARSNRLAYWMIANGHARGRPIAVCMKRGVELVVSIMAIMKSGSPYLPIDQGYPAQRVDYILRDSDAALLLCDQASLDRIQGMRPGLEIRRMDDELFVEACARCPDDIATLAAIRQLSDKHLAYVVYTSGSTGQPKGVMVRQESFLNLVLWYLHDYDFSSDDRGLLLGSIGFDMTQKNLFAPLLAGGTLVIPDEYYDPAALVALIADERVTVINCAPSAAYPLVESPAHWQRLSSLRLLALGGEAIRLSHLRPWLRSEQCRARLLNMYGPSECTDIAIAADYSKDEAADHALTVPIGRPIYNCSAYVLNAQMKLQPRGVIGELFLGGIGVSDGYIHLDDLNRSSFLDDVLPGAGRIYRTGDLAKMDSDGVFHYVGRADHQVKIRGYRVETAEIDAIVANCPGVRQVMTQACEDANGETSLVCFVVLKDPGTGPREDDEVFTSVRQSLLGRLPVFMIPSKFVLLEEMPLTPNGKIDKRELQARAPLVHGWRFLRKSRAPADDTQAKILALWSELLGADDIGVDDNFFELGGHSLLATRFTGKAIKAFDLDESSLSVKEFFHHPTIEAVARLIDAKRRYGALLAKEKSMLESGAAIEEGSF